MDKNDIYKAFTQTFGGSDKYGSLTTSLSKLRERKYIAYVHKDGGRKDITPKGKNFLYRIALDISLYFNFIDMKTGPRVSKKN